MDKYEHLTGEKLGYKPSVLEQAKCEYSPLGKVFNKGLDGKDEKEGFLRRLKNIEDKNEEQLKAIKGKTDLKSKIDLFDEDLTLEAIVWRKESKDIGDNVDYNKLVFTCSNKKDFENFETLEKSIKDIHSKNMTMGQAEIKQNEFAKKIDKLRVYPARGPIYINLKLRLSTLV